MTLSVKLFAVDLTITSSGVYFLGDDLESSTITSPDTILLITVNNVVLDLAGHTIRQLNTTANVNGIALNSGVTDVTIQNGKIEAVTNRGILANINCARIIIQNMSFVRCANRALSFEGTGGTISDVNVLDCAFYQCSQSGTADFIVSFIQTTRVIMKNCEIDGSTNATASLTLTAVGAQSTFASVFENIVVRGCVAPNLRGFFFDGSVAIPTAGNRCQNCYVTNNTASGSGVTGGIFNGFLFNTNTTQNILQDCGVLQNAAVAIGASGGTLVGINIVAASNLVDTFIGCVVEGNTANGAASASCRGFFIQAGATNINFLRCLAIANSTNTGTALAIGLDITVNNSVAVISECRFLRNTNSASAANSFGVRVPAAATGILFSESISFSNGGTASVAGNQFNNMPAGSIFTPGAPASSNLGALATSRWNNIAIAA